jgi:hypothetical protein
MVTLHGWTLPEIHAIARSAALSNRWLVSDFAVRYEAAWDGIIDEILGSQSPPSRHDLQAAGKGAVSRGMLKDFCHTYGVAERDLTAGIGSAPRFAAYWFERGRDDFAERGAERIALAQVLAALPPKHVRTLQTLAAVPDLQSAAEAAGISRGTFKQRVIEARRAFERLWYSPETPPSGKRRPRRYSPSEWNESRKAPCGTHAAYKRHKGSGDECSDPEGCREAYLRDERERKQAARERAA